MKFPEWVKNLPKGIYTIEELQKYTNLSKNSIRLCMRLLKVITEKKRMTHNEINVYYWEGYQDKK